MTHTEMMKAAGIVEGSLLCAPDDAPRIHALDWIHSGASSLAARAMAGDDEAFAALVRPHLNLFTSGIHRILQDAQDTQEALQEALLDIHAELGRFHGKSSFCAWAYHICLDEALRVRRSRTRRRENNIEDLVPRGPGEGHSRPQKGSRA